MNSSGEITTRQIDRLIAQQERTADSMRESVSEASKTFTLQSELFKIEQRPYVWAKNYETGDITNDRPTIINITFINGGKGIARKVDTRFRNVVLAENERIALMKFSEMPPPESIGISVPPGEPFFISVTGILSASEVMEMASFRRNLYVYGSVFYEDIRGTKHRTDWCAVAIPNGHTFGKCQYFNDMN